MTTAVLGTARRNHAIRVPARRSGERANASVAHAAKLAERARIARELHDGVSQTLYGIILAASHAHSLCRQKHVDEMQRAIEAVLKLATSGQSELRATLCDLRSGATTSGGLASALASLVADARTSSDLDIRLSLASESHLPSTAEAALAMITREALNNVVRHAEARRVDIVLEVDAQEVVLAITDDGRGFDPGQFGSGHFGLLSMRERAQAAGGALELDSAPGFGTQVRIRLHRASAA